VKRLCMALVLICLIAFPLLAQSQRGWEIVRADYGSGNNWVDVTERVRSLVENDTLSFRVDAKTMGEDSRRGRNRALRLQLRDSNGRTRQVTYRAGQLITLQIYNYQSGLRINRAVYGAGNNASDVTSRLNSQIQGDQLNLRVNNDTMGGDPAPNQVKTLTVQYAINGQTNQVVVNEGDTLRLPDGNSSQSNLYINRAVYGTGNRTSDVTSRLKSQIQGDQLNLRVTNETMGGDPAPNQVKTLTVQYAVNGRTSEVTIHEGDTLRLPNGVTGQSSLQINHAVYGAGNRNFDVTSRLNSQIRGDQLNLRVTNDTMGGDPAPNEVKTLTVQYAVNGRASQATFHEGDTLRLPNGVASGELTQRIRCESLDTNGYGRQYCAANTQYGVRLSRTLGNSTCDQGSSWGYDQGGVWVDKGCRGEFEMQGNGVYPGTFSSATIPNGTELSVRTNEAIDSKSATVGQRFSAVVAADVVDSSGRVTIARGSDAELVIRSTSGGSISSASDLVLDVDSITISGRRYLVSTTDLDKQGGQGVGANRRTGIMVGGGAAVGTLIGAIVGGGRGAAIGAAVGAGAGVGTEILTKGSQVRVPAETLLTFRLDQDLRLQASR
jgi:membrane-bound inhibitor of C-type lysozyme